MCFSATASFTAAGVLTVIGILTARVAPSKPLRLIASLPLFFALQQFLEGIVWVTLSDGHTDGTVHALGIYGFLFFAGVFWPIWIPYVLHALESDPARKKILKDNLRMGAFTAMICLLALISIGNQAQIVLNHMAYPPTFGELDDYMSIHWKTGYFAFLALYFWVTVGSCIVSTLRNVWILGLLWGIAFIITSIFYAYALGSVWCYFSAIISIAAYFIVRGIKKEA